MRATVPAYCEGPSARSRLSWVLLDWGASSYSTIQITVMVAYVKAVFKAHNPWPVSPAAVWAWTLGLAMLMSATLTPIAAGWADRYGRHRAALAFSVLTGSLACIGLGLAPPTWPATTVTLVAISAVGFDLAAIFTGALLPAVAFGLFHVGSKLGGFAASMGFGLVHELSGRPRAGLLLLFLQLVAGWLLLARVPIDEEPDETEAQSAIPSTSRIE